MKTNLEMQAQISKLNQVLDSKDNLQQELEEKQRFILEMQSQKTDMHKELEQAADHIID